MRENSEVSVDTVGLLGLGLMGRGIAACLLCHGRKVVAYNRSRGRAEKARTFLAGVMEEVVRRGVFPAGAVADWAERFTVVDAISGLAECPFVVESVKEDIELKRRLYAELEKQIAPDAVIASNTSSFPLTLLQAESVHPARFVVMHWAEPTWITRFMEIVRNELTSEEAVARTRALGLACGKQPSFLNFDIRGFIANRLMYAMIREACHLYELDVADAATIDRSFRNDTGWWATLAGPFRWMDLTGLEAYGLVMEGLLPELCNRKTVPEIMNKMIAEGAQGTANCRGFYEYDERTAKAWEKTWIEFTYDIRDLIIKHESRLRDAGALEE